MARHNDQAMIAEATGRPAPRGRALSGGQSRRRGSGVVETALLLPVILYLIFGCVEFGYYFYVKHSLDGAARDGARAAAASGAVYADVTTAVSNAMAAANLAGSGYQTVVQDNGTTIASLGGAVSGDTITVRVYCTWGTVASGFRMWGFIGSSKTVSGYSGSTKE